MPEGKNDSTRSYKGNEPSPKGKGFCAQTEREGKKMKGQDGHSWKVTKDRIGRKSWRPAAGAPGARRFSSPRKPKKKRAQGLKK